MLQSTFDIAFFTWGKINAKAIIFVFQKVIALQQKQTFLMIG